MAKLAEWIAFKPQNKKWPWCVTQGKAFNLIKYSITPAVGFNVDKWVVLSTDGIIYLTKGYRWNGMTGAPLWLERNYLQNMLPGSAVHDALYQLIRLGAIAKKDRFKCDLILYKMWLRDGVPKPIAWLGYRVVRLFGGFFI